MPKRLRRRDRETLERLRRRAARARRRRDWEALLQIGTKALTIDVGDAGWHALVALAHQRSGDLDAAARSYEAAIERDPSDRALYLRLGRVFHKSSDWRAAARVYRAAIERDPTVPQPYFRLGEMLARSKEWRAADSALRLGLERDPDASRLDDELLSLKMWRFEPRRRIIRFVSESLPEILGGITDGVQGAPPRVHVYWGQGFEGAPATVAMCEQQMRLHHPSHDLALIDDEGADRLEVVPPAITEKVRSNRRVYSDVLRTALLARFGGVWMDATCLVRTNVIDLLPRLLRSGFFAFDFGNARISSWFLASEPGGYIATAMREAQFAYWRHHDKAIDYYVLHHLFEALYVLDERFRNEWLASATTSARAAHALKHVLHEPFDGDRLRSTLAKSFVHKLSYKRPVVPGSMHEHLLENGPPQNVAEAPWNLDSISTPAMKVRARLPERGLTA